MNGNVDIAEVKKLLNGGIVLLLGICMVLVLLGLFGATKVTLNVPDNSTIYLNGHAYETSQTLKLRPSTYQLSIAGPLYKASTITLKLHYFGSKTIDAGSFQNRKPVNILSSAIGAYGEYGPPSFDNVKTFQNNTWIAGLVGPSTSSPIALHYTKGAWQVGYFDEQSFDSDPSLIPVEVANYVSTLRTGSNE